MNNRLKRAAFITAAAVLCSATGPYLSVIYKSSETDTAKPVKKNFTAQIVSAEQTDPIIERLTFACEENNQKEIDSVCDAITAEMDAAKEEVAAYSLDISDWADDEIKARQEKYENELNIKYAQTAQAVKEIRSGINTEKNLSIISENITEPKEHHYSDATPNIEEAVKDIETVSDDHITKSANVNSPAPTDNDLKFDGKGDFPEVITVLANSLGDANSIYLYVKNSIKTEAYWGSKKEAAITLAQQGGNDIDQASLLIALLRAKGIPARYVTGTVRITPQQAMDITGASDENAAGRLIAGGFRNAKRIKDNGKITGYMMTRTWVEAYIPYTDYRGAGNISGDNVWVQLDPSFKKVETSSEIVKTDLKNDALDIVSNVQKYYEAKNDSSAAPSTAEVTFYTQKIAESKSEYVPATLPYTLESVESRYSFIKDSDKDNIMICVDGEVLLRAPVSELYGKPVTISYEPKSASDQAVINNYDKFTDVPAYLVNVVPVVTVGTKKYYITDSDLAWIFETQLGTQHEMEIYISSNGNTTTLVDNITSGSMYALNLDLQTITNDDLMACNDRMEKAEANYTPKNMCTPGELGTFLDYAGKSYFSLCDAQAESYSRIMNIDKTRHLGVAITGYRFARSATFGMVRNLDYGSFYIDVAYNSALTINLDGDKEKENEYVLGLGSIESYFESYIWEQLIDPTQTCISTISVTNAAAEQGIAPVYITQSNADKKLEGCNVTDDVKQEVMNFVNRGLMVELIPETLTIGDWTGTAYTAIDMETGSASYMISGGTAGGSSMNFENLFDINQKLVCINIDLCDIAMMQGYMTLVQGEFKNDAKDIVSGANTMINSAVCLGCAMKMRYDNYDFIFEYAEKGETDEVMNKYLDFTLKNLLDTFATVIAMTANAAGQILDGISQLLPAKLPSDIAGIFANGLKRGSADFITLYHYVTADKVSDYTGEKIDKWTWITILTDALGRALT